MSSTSDPQPASAGVSSEDPGVSGGTSNPLLFIHLSDLHFSSRPADSKWELDQTLRNELGHDLRGQIRKRGGATALLVSGDIAFSGATIEYANARAFLTDLCVNLGVPTEDVWVVPGNHDVELSRQAQLETAKARLELMAAAEHEIDSVLERLMKQPTDARALLAPLANYFDFAADFGCQPPSSELAWDAVFAMGDGYILRIRGVNSALVSDRDDERKLPQLVVGSVQTQLARKPGTIHVTVCHHPPRWIRDRTQLEAMFDNNSQLQLTGHEHRFAANQTTTVKVAAGALHPKRDKIDWEPRYDLISVAVTPARAPGENAWVRICVASRVWDKASVRWIADQAADSSDKVCFSVPLDDVATIEFSALNATAERYETSPADQRVERVANRRRRLVHRFARLYEAEQRALAENLGLTLGEIAALEQGALTAAVIERAAREDALADLWDAVEHAHGVPGGSTNPFREDS